MLWKHPATKISYKAKLTRNVSLCVCILYLYLYFVFVFVFETNLNYICSDAYQRVHKIIHKAKIEKKSFVDSYLEGFIGQTRHVCLRETAATAVRECKEFQKRSLFFICCILCLFSQVCNQTIPPPPWLTTGKDTTRRRLCV